MRQYSIPQNGIKTPEWWEERRPEFERLWVEGKSTKEIGRHFGVTKNAAAGKASRWGLTGRESPILPKRPEEPKPLFRPKSTLPDFAEHPTEDMMVVLALREPTQEIALEAPPEAFNAPAAATLPATSPERAPASAQAPAVAHGGGIHVRFCQEVFERDGRLGAGYGLDYVSNLCGAVVEDGKPYCTAHCKKNYQRVQIRELKPFIPRLFAPGLNRSVIDPEA